MCIRDEVFLQVVQWFYHIDTWLLWILREHTVMPRSHGVSLDVKNTLYGTSEAT